MRHQLHPERFREGEEGKQDGEQCWELGSVRIGEELEEVKSVKSIIVPSSASSGNRHGSVVDD